MNRFEIYQLRGIRLLIASFTLVGV